MAIETLSSSTPSIIDLQGYHFECCCGEQFNNVDAASTCKKCRNYSVWGYTKYVIDLRTDEVVYGNFPTEEEYKAALACAELRWEEERRQWEFDIQMWQQEGELYEAEMQRQREEA
ncbi:MAG: hypothetical protein VXY99_01720, partial [Pseudomonadota bacterium]|nr:hypothetical protein [Pseudomonadota bacterium]